MPTPEDVTRLLADWQQGDPTALEQLIPLVYEELRRRAAAYLARERPGHTLQPTALVHETFLRLAEQRNIQWKNRSHFLGVSAQLMRLVLVDHARSRRAAKRGGGARRVTFTDELAREADGDELVVALDDALRQLEELDPRQSRVVEMRFFGGLSVEETAAALDLSPATVKREFRMARAWLRARLSD